MRRLRPKQFYADKDIRVIARKNFENTITSLEEAHIVNARFLTTYQLYSKIDYFEDKAERLKREFAK